MDLLRSRASPCYWGGRDAAQQLRVLRALWFVEKHEEFQPCGFPLSEILEAAHAARVWNSATPQANGLTAARVPVSTGARAAMGFTSGLHALFESETAAWLAVDSIPGKLLHATGLSGGDKSSPGLRLRRGIVPSAFPPLGEEEREDDRTAHLPVTTLLLVTHGIGHSLDFVDIITDAACLRRNLNAHSRSFAPPEGGSRPAGRVMLLPVQWRQQLVLAGERSVDDLVPESVSLRQVG